MASHKEYCGSRTELCEKCNKYIKFRDLEEHSSINCELMKAEVPKNREETTVPVDMLRAMGLRDDQMIYDEDSEFSHDLLSSEMMKILGYGTPPVPYEPGATNESGFPARNVIPRGPPQPRRDNYGPMRNVRADGRGTLRQDDGEHFQISYFQNGQESQEVVNTRIVRPRETSRPREQTYKPLPQDDEQNYFEQDDDDDDDGGGGDVMKMSYLQNQQGPFSNRHLRVIQSRVADPESISRASKYEVLFVEISIHVNSLALQMYLHL